ncbi:PIG-L deacetylase family protein [Nocardiopsis alba]|uniref:PIG-L deacetylase family protein n=1 Tax=Nocardiopsis alba TaxID=53437 RepID=UPI00366C67BD
MRVLAIGAHPDDIEILAAGTLAKYRGAGGDVAMCVLTDGSLGADSGGRSEISDIRRAEACEAAEIIDASLYRITRPDGFLFDDTDVRGEVAEVIRDFRPSVILTHAPDDYHADHRTTGAITFAARQLAAARPHSSTSPAIETLPRLFYMDNLALTGGTPDIWVDISDFIEVKRAMIRCHRSQNALVRRSEGIDYVDYVERQALLRGLQCGVPHAEGFRCATGFPRSPTHLP